MTLRARIAALVEHGPIDSRVAVRILEREGWTLRDIRAALPGVAVAPGGKPRYWYASRQQRHEWIARGNAERARASQRRAADRAAPPVEPAAPQQAAVPILGPCAQCGQPTTAWRDGLRCCWRLVCREGAA